MKIKEIGPEKGHTILAPLLDLPMGHFKFNWRDYTME